MWTEAQAPQQPRVAVQPGQYPTHPTSRAVIAFGFGGRVATIFPPSAAPKQLTYDAPMQGTVLRTWRTAELMGSHPVVQAVKAWPGPVGSHPGAPAANKVREHINSDVTLHGLAAAEARDSGLDGCCGGRLAPARLLTAPHALSVEMRRVRCESISLWKVLALMLQHKGPLLEGADPPRRGAAAEAVAEFSHSTGELDYSAGGAAEDAEPAVGFGADPSALPQLGASLASAGVEATIETAAETGQWTHALLLSQGLGPAAFKRTLSRFLGTMPSHSPLSSLYHVQAGQAVKLIGGDQSNPVFKAGFLSNWRQHAATLIRTFGAEKGVPHLLVALGDVLWRTCGSTPAAHMLYLLAGGTPSREPQLKHCGPHSTPSCMPRGNQWEAEYGSSSRMVLVGGNHRGFGTAFRGDTISLWRTEVWEFAAGRGKPTPASPALAPYKLMHALWLTDLGMLGKASDYLAALEHTVRSCGASLPTASPPTAGTAGPFHPAFLTSLALLRHRLTQAGGGQRFGVGLGQTGAAGGAGEGAASRAGTSWLGGLLGGWSKSAPAPAPEPAPVPAPPASAAPQPAPAPHTSQPGTAPAPAPEAAPKPSGAGSKSVLSGWLPSLQGIFVRKGVTVAKGFNPNAAPSAEPVWDEAKGRLVFPGDDSEDEVAEGPPPMAMAPAPTPAPDEQGTGPGPGPPAPGVPAAGPVAFGGSLMRRKKKQAPAAAATPAMPTGAPFGAPNAAAGTSTPPAGAAAQPPRATTTAARPRAEAKRPKWGAARKQGGARKGRKERLGQAAAARNAAALAGHSTPSQPAPAEASSSAQVQEDAGEPAAPPPAPAAVPTSSGGGQWSQWAPPPGASPAPASGDVDEWRAQFAAVSSSLAAQTAEPEPAVGGAGPSTTDARSGGASAGGAGIAPSTQAPVHAGPPSSGQPVFANMAGAAQALHTPGHGEPHIGL